MKKEITVFILVLFSSSLLGQGKITCFLSGQTFERPQNEIVLLTPYNTDSRVKDPIVIEIVNNRFEYKLVCDEEELYELVFQSNLFNGSWNPTYFMSENGTVTFKLYPLEKSFYNDFKEKGFTVVGVARENKIEDGKNALEKDGYTWLNLVELKDENNIWAKYGIGNAGGAQFLVDKDGYILKVDPSAEEVREILNEKLK